MNHKAFKRLKESHIEKPLNKFVFNEAIADGKKIRVKHLYRTAFPVFESIDDEITNALHTCISKIYSRS